MNKIFVALFLILLGASCSSPERRVQVLYQQWKAEEQEVLEARHESEEAFERYARALLAYSNEKVSRIEKQLYIGDKPKDRFEEERAALSVVIDRDPVRADEAQAVLDRMLRLVTELSN